MEFERIADKQRLDFILEAVITSAPPGGQVLDIGCGNGIISKAIGTHGFRVRATDVSEKTIEEAIRMNAHPNVIFEAVPAGKLSVSADRYDAVICSEVLEHLTDPSSLLAVIRASLAPAGVLVVTVPNGYGPREVLVTRPVQYLQRQDSWLTRLVFRSKRAMGFHGVTIQSSAEDLRHIQFFTAKTLRKLARESGFRIVQIRPANFLEQVFPFSLLTRKSRLLQQADLALAGKLPLAFTSGFLSLWKKPEACSYQNTIRLYSCVIVFLIPIPMKNAHKGFLVATFISYVLLYTLIAFIS